MEINNLSLLQLFAAGQTIHSGIGVWTDSLSGIFLLVLAGAVVCNVALARKADELIKIRSYTAVMFMGLMLAVQLIVGRAGIGQLGLDRATNELATVLGCTAVILGVILNSIARIQLGTWWSNNIVVYRGQKLVTRGLYGVVRHPLYATILLTSIGLAIQYQNWISFALFLLIYVPLVHLRTIKEEWMLKKSFPDYDGYSTLVPMLVPFVFKTFFSTQEVRVHSWAFRIYLMTIVMLLALALYFHCAWIVALTFLLMCVSALRPIEQVPAVRLYEFCFKKLGIIGQETVDVNANRFAQGFGAFLLLSSITLFYVYHHPVGGWILVAIVACSTALGSLGYCTGVHIYFFMRRLYQANV
jgi:protein-S-isoprenylcysteine O-methyltransferase Ste14